jgi:hypothetical protein
MKKAAAKYRMVILLVYTISGKPGNIKGGEFLLLM